MSKFSQLTNNLYRGDVSYNIVGNQKRWYIVSAVLLLICIGSLIFRGLNFGVEFTGGTVVTLPTESCSVSTAEQAFTDSGVSSEVPIITEVSGTSGRAIRVQTVTLKADDSAKLAKSLADACQANVDDASIQSVGPSWGQEITKKALTGLVVFLLAIVIYLSIAFEWRMAIAAIVALIHDVVITIGIFSVVGFEVTPASVIGLLTILGYSLYDTVVVFDKVKENTRSLTAGSRMTYSEAANLAVNQTLVRSINTSIVGLLPVAALLFVGAYVLGAGTLKDLALALFVGIAVGTYSSIFIATPVLADLKEREPANAALRTRVMARRAARGEEAPSTGTVQATRTRSGATATAAAAGAAVAVADDAAGAGAGADDDADDTPASTSGDAGSRSGTQRNQPKRSKKRRR